MKQSDDRFHALFEHKIDQIVVMIQAGFVHRCTRQRKWQDPSPCDAEGIVFNSHRSQTFDVLLVEIIILIRDVIVHGVETTEQIQ